jgi:outer membrane protein OmpA-like peptidoglycan-associated protein
MKNIKIILFVILSMLVQLLDAQTKNDPWAIGLWGVKTEYSGDLGNNVFKFGNDFHAGGALSLDRYISRFFDVGIYGSLSSTGMNNGISIYPDFDQWLNRSEYNNEVQNFKIPTLTTFDIHTRFKIWGSEKAHIVPYIGVAAGMAFYNNLQTSYIDVNGNQQIMNYQRPDGGWHDVGSVNAITLGGIVGLEWRISPAVSLRYQANGNWTDHDNRDFYANGSHDLQLQHNIGLTFNISGKRKDIDGDGVADYLDQCPKIFGDPRNHGCPVDSDGDGIPDNLDFCPDTPKGVIVDEKGCPIDTDKDGVPDYLDQCPDTPLNVAVDEKGCPKDTDKDGVIDSLDECPETPEGVKVDEKGCPLDTDGDGVPDYLDKCPTEFGLPENNGCQFNPVLFDFGQATPNNTDAISKLDSIVSILTQQPEYICIVAGHTDSVGTAAYNQQLSVKRAETVRQYLIQNGVDKNRITVTGYGFDQPATDDKTPEGRARNRRAEIVIKLEE